MFRVELAKAFHRWRTYLLAAAIGGIPIVIVFALKVSPPDPGAAEDAPPFLFQITSNGLFAALTYFVSLAARLCCDAVPASFAFSTFLTAVAVTGASEMSSCIVMFDLRFLVLIC